jgi:hypothetical protein
MEKEYTERSVRLYNRGIIKHVATYLSLEEAAQLKEYAKQRGQSVSAVLREMICETLKKENLDSRAASAREGTPGPRP